MIKRSLGVTSNDIGMTVDLCFREGVVSVSNSLTGVVTEHPHSLDLETVSDEELDEYYDTYLAISYRRVYVDTIGLSSIDVVFFDNGCGVIIDQDEEEKFTHVLAIDGMSDRELYDYFWREINPHLDDPYLSEDDLADQELAFENGDIGEFSDLIEASILSDPTVPPELEVQIQAATDDDSAWVSVEPSNERIERLILLLIHEFRPYGWSWEYNDQWDNRQSGYDLQPCQFSYFAESYEDVTPRERMAKLGVLRRWLEEHGYDPSVYLETTLVRG